MLALDPFYEMFPTTYRRSYPWYRYSWGDATTPITIKPTMSVGTKIAIGAGVATAVGVGVVLFARRRR